MAQSFEMRLLLVMLVFLMLGMGATLTVGDFREIIKKPRAFFVGILSQYGWMPLVAYALASILQLPPAVAIGLIALGCTPGGSTSNVFTYFSKGNLALSVSMTVTSTLLAVIMMPFLLYVYAQPFTDEALQIPFSKIAANLAVVPLPVCLGMLIRSKSLRWARRVEKFASLLGVAVIAFLLVTWIPENRELLANTGTKVYVAAVCQAVLGFVLGFLFSKLLGLGRKDARTVSIETGVQNTALTLGVLMLSFPQERSVLVVPLMFAFLVVALASMLTLLFRVQDRLEAVARKEAVEGV